MLRAMSSWMRRTLVELTIGAVIGFVVWCLIGKSLTSMLFASLGGSFSCKADVEVALDKFVSMQVYSALAGAVVVAVVMAIVRRALKNRSKAAEGAVARPAS